ncbi:polysaccharide deacetylase family protein [Paenibacillus sp. CMAA1364]
MNISICKWYNNAASPVLLMIDDLANTWVDTTHHGILRSGDDWGYHKHEKDSSFRFLCEQILQVFPKVKVTFFVPVGIRVGMLLSPMHPQISLPINADENSKTFFKSIHEHPNYELAYHGTTHGQVGEHAIDFIQEWATFKTLDEAMDTIEEGIEIYQDAIGVRPQGGKYCGYTSNSFSDDSIDHSGFAWWCRYWNRGITDDAIDGDICGKDPNPITNLDVKRFGKHQVIDIPSTLNGALLNGVYQKGMTLKGCVKRILKRPYIRWKLREVKYLLTHQLVISIQEHIAPSRNDGKRQSPNIFDDRDSLIGILQYLKDKDVWYCTGSELAQYVNVRDRVKVQLIKEDVFILEHSVLYSEQVITLKMSVHKILHIICPNEVIVDVRDGIVNIPVMEGQYSIIKG